MHLAANVSIIFSRIPFLERFAAARAAGFDLVEVWWPRAEMDDGLTEDQIVAAVAGAGVGVVLLNFDGGYLPAGDRGLAGEPDRAADFRNNVPRALELAGRLGCSRLNALAGKQVPGATLGEQQDLLRDSIRYAADAAAATGATVLLEPLNLIETAGYLLPDVPSALDMIDRVGRPNVRVQFDAYHVARGGADPVAVVLQAGSLIGHVQLADLPGRHEPGTGSLPIAELLGALREVGYAGDIGLEYVPTTPDAPSFDYLEGLRSLLASGSSHVHEGAMA